jgi:mono/diheme cytochrome c family protein
MTPVVDALHKQNEIDVFAIAAYVGTLRAGEKPIDQARVGPPGCAAAEGAKVFEARYAQCHRNKGATVPLALQTSIHAPVPDSVVQVIWSGIRPPTGALGRSMPAFGPQMSKAEMTARAARDDDTADHDRAARIADVEVAAAIGLPGELAGAGLERDHEIFASTVNRGQ